MCGSIETMECGPAQPMRWANWSVTLIKRKGQSNDESTYASPR